MRENPREPLLSMALLMKMMTSYYGQKRSRLNCEPMSRRKVAVASKNYAHMLSYCLQAQAMIWNMKGSMLLKLKYPIDIESILNKTRDELIQMWRYDGHLINKTDLKGEQNWRALSRRRVEIDPDIVLREMGKMPKSIQKNFSESLFHLFNTGELVDSQDLYRKELTEDAKTLERVEIERPEEEMERNPDDFVWEKLTLDTGDLKDLNINLLYSTLSAELAADKFDFGEEFEKLNLVLKRAPSLAKMRDRMDDNEKTEYM